MTYEKRTVVDGHLEPNSFDDGEWISSDDDRGVFLADLLPGQAQPSYESDMKPPSGRFEIIVRFTPEEGK